MLKKYWLPIMGLISTLSVLPTQATDIEDCLSIQNDYVALSESGKYRYTKPVKEHELTQVDFDTLANYQEYLVAAKQVIDNKNPKADMPCPIVTETYQQLAAKNQWDEIPKVSQLVAPYELTQSSSKKGVLLIHGLTDSPYSFHDISQIFYQQGFNVRTLLMPGHGTAPSDLIDVKYRDWQVAAKFAIEQTLKDYDEVYLGGLSTGGALIFNYLMEQEKVDQKIKGLFMWSPASKAKNKFSWLAKYVDLIPFVNWLDRDADIDFAKYESFPFNAGAQVDGIMKLVVGPDRNLQTIPIFVVASEHDQTIDTKHTLQLVQDWQLASSAEQMKKSTLIYYGNENNLPTKLSGVMKLIVPECSPKSLCSEVLDVSHIATTHSPGNPHYGISGQYRNCGHYAVKPKRHEACKQNKQVIKGETTAENLAHDFPMQRLTYNPYYKEMRQEMLTFLKATH